MKTAKLLTAAILFIILVVASIFFYVGYFKPSNAGIIIETIPASAVYIDQQQVGRTPYKDTLKPGEITLKLVPDSFEKPLTTYETKIVLASGIETVVRREFGESEEMSSGEILSFEKEGGSNSSLSVVSVPDSAQVSIDGAIKAFTPYKTSALDPGKHSLTISASGFDQRSFDVRTYKGYKLTVIAKLAPSPEKQEETQVEQVEEPEEEVAIMIRILETPTGYLRVRGEPSTLGEEVGRAEPGETFELLEEDEDTGWYKIEFEEGQFGWISNEYAEVINDKISVTPTPTTR